MGGYGGNGGHGVDLFNRMGNIDEGVDKSGTVSGAKGVYSSSAANIDSSGKGTYKVGAGKIK